MKKFLVIALLTLSGCGGSGAGPVAVAPPPAPTNPPPDPDPILTAEFLESPVLAHINADAAYRDGITGSGVVFASLEDGIDDQHPELINRIHPSSRAFGGDITRGIKSTGEHGTRTGGIIVAERNDVGTHGVAYDAQILLLSVEDSSDCFLDPHGVLKCTSFFEAIPEAIDFAVAEGVKIIMIQRGAASSQAEIDAAGLTTEFENIAAAYERGLDAGVVFIGPAGNGTLGDPITANPLFFPYLSIGQLAGNEFGVIAVGSVDANNNLYTWQTSSGGTATSHAAGVAAEFFLVAPSVAPYVKKDGTLTTKFRPGTSNSAPHVVGAAVLLQQAFPNLTGREIVQILLETATDLGAPGTDPIFGRGLLNIEAALQPLGTTMVSTFGGNIFSIDTTAAIVSPAFGDAFSSAEQLNQVMMLDSFDRSFIFDLSGQVYEPGQRGVRFESFLGSGNAVQSFDVRMGVGGSLSFSFFNPNRNFNSAEQVISGPFKDTFNTIHPLLFYSANWNEDLRMDLSWGVSASSLLDRQSQLAKASSIFTMASAFRNQYAALAGDVIGGTVTRLVSDKIEMSFGMTMANHDADPLAYGNTLAVAKKPSASTYETIASFVYRTNKNSLRLKGGIIIENETVLGSRSSGALKLGDGATTYTGSIEATHDLGGGRLLFGFMQQGLTEVDGGVGSFVSGVDSFRTSSFALGIIDRGIFTKADMLGVSVSQPLRVENGSINLILPTGRDYSADRLLFSAVDLGLAPTGREIDLEVSYRIMRSGVRFDASFMVTRHQGHNSDEGIGGNLVLRSSTLF